VTEGLVVTGVKVVVAVTIAGTIAAVETEGIAGIQRDNY
jgi:hypothetical protein